MELESLEGILERIRERRRKLHLSQAQLAKKAGVSQKLISQIESGEQSNPSYNNIRKIIDVLEITPEEMPETTVTAEDLMTKDIKSLITTEEADNTLKMMRKHRFSQAPVYEDEYITGSLLILDLVEDEKNLKGKTIQDYIKPPFPVIHPKTTAENLINMLRTNKALIIQEKGKTKGIITEEDIYKINKTNTIHKPAGPASKPLQETSQ